MDQQNHARFIALAVMIVLATICILTPIVVTYCRLISCTWCHEPFAIYPRPIGDLCRSCSSVFDGHRSKAGRRRSLLRRIQIWRRAA